MNDAVNGMEEQKVKLRLCYNAVVEKKAEDVLLLDLRKVTSSTDFFLICHAPSTRQVGAISDNVERLLRKNGFKRFHAEGKKEGTWVLVDAGDVVIHIFQKETRGHYDLEDLWIDATKIEAEEIESWEAPHDDE